MLLLCGGVGHCASCRACALWQLAAVGPDAMDSPGPCPPDHLALVSPGHFQAASMTSGCGRYIRRITNHGSVAEVGSQFGFPAPPGGSGSRQMVSPPSRSYRRPG